MIASGRTPERGPQGAVACVVPRGGRGPRARGPRAARRGAQRGHGERPRSQLLLKLAGPGNMRILAVNSLAVNGALPLYVESKSVLYTQYSVKKCLTSYEVSYPLSVLF